MHSAAPFASKFKGVVMPLGSQPAVQEQVNVHLRLVVLCTLLSAGSAIAGCSSNKAKNVDGAPNSGPGASQPGKGSPMQTAGSGGAPSSGTAGAPSSSGAPSAGKPTGGTAGMGSTGGATKDGGHASGSGETGDTSGGAKADCTEVKWDNPGMVGNPMVMAVPDDAGMGHAFEQTTGMDDYDYVMEEFFFSNTSPAAYTTRMTVKRPKDPAKFSGTVFVEWYNVSGGIDFAVMWANSREYFMREGDVFIGVSAQQVGNDALKSFDSGRYSSLQHPGDDYAGNIFSQAAVAIRLQSETLLGKCMPVHALIAVGQSQSAFQLAGYVDNRHPMDKVYDGYLIHSGLEPASNDPGVPTFVVFTMTEGNGSLMDGPTLVEWMVAGATHNDERVTSRGSADLGKITGIPTTMCVNPLNTFPSYRAYNAVLDWLTRWVRNGDKPPAGMPFQMANGQIALDEYGNALGGVRLPDIDVPIATYNLDNGPTDPTDFVGFLACGLGGQTVLFSADELTKLYPTHDDYVTKYTDAAKKAMDAGYLLKTDYAESIDDAKAAAIPK